MVSHVDDMNIYHVYPLLVSGIIIKIIDVFKK